MRRALLAAALVLASCAKEAASLTPFPCAADGTCPSGVLCLPGTGCVSPLPDAVCSADADCGAGLRCSLGRCAATCLDGAGCGTGRSCSGAKGTGVCLADCSAGETCPAQLSCSASWVPGKHACMPAGTAYEEDCATQGAACGPPGASGTCDLGKCELGCAGGAGCPSGWLCTAQTGAGVCYQECGAPTQVCPGGLSCNALWYGGKKACMAAALGLDLPCTGAAHCGPAGAASVCDLGRCGVASQGAAGCPAGRVASTATGAGVCLVDCSAGAACPGDFVCNGPWSDGKRYCVPPGTGVASICTGACAPLGTNAICDNGLCNLPCTEGAGCPAGSLCARASGAASCVLDCTAGQTCPTGLSCNDLFSSGSRACLPAGEGTDQPCPVNGASCGPKGSAALCGLGACELPCTNGAGCPAGRICSSQTGAGVCVLDCGAGQSCPAGGTCHSLHSGGRYGCTPGTVPACASVSGVNGCPYFSSCGITTGTSGTLWNVSCGNGVTCVQGSACVGSNQCQCQHAYSFNCTSESCGTATCSYPGWSCRYAAAEAIGCTDPAVNSSGTCNCTDGRTVALGCATQPNLVDVVAPSCELACGKECDLVAQSGCAGGRSKCAALRNGAVWLPSCVAPAGSVAEGSVCSRSASDASGAGQDNCAPGLFCTDIQGGGGFVCRRHCNSRADCTGSGGTACAMLTGSQGICVPAQHGCLPQNARVCPANETCSPYQISDGTWFYQCRLSGPVLEAQPCSDESDCGLALTCQPTSKTAGARVCTPLCGTAGCSTASGLVCQELPGIATYGVCF